METLKSFFKGYFEICYKVGYLFFIAFTFLGALDSGVIGAVVGFTLAATIMFFGYLSVFVELRDIEARKVDHLLLAPDLMDLVREGKKSATIRMGKRTFKSLNNFRLINNEDETDIINVVITSSFPSSIKYIPRAILNIAGKEKSPKEYLKNTLLRFYPDATMDSIVTIIEFEKVTSLPKEN